MQSELLMLEGSGAVTTVRGILHSRVPCTANEGS